MLLLFLVEASLNLKGNPAPFVLYGPLFPIFSQVSVDQLNELLELCGATTVKNPTEFSKHRHSLIIMQIDKLTIEEKKMKAINYFKLYQVLTFSHEWVLDCLSAYSILPIANQIIPSNENNETLLNLMGF